MARLLIAVYMTTVLCFINRVQAGRLTATFCRSCDSFQPIHGDDCSQTSPHVYHEIAKGSDENCIIRYAMTSSGMRITKGIASNDTCRREYDPTCDRQSLVSGTTATHPAQGTVCSFCCRAPDRHHIHCSEGPFPDPGTEVLNHPPVQPTQATSTSVTSTFPSYSSPSTLTHRSTSSSSSSPAKSTTTTSRSSTQSLYHTSNVCSLCTITPVDVGVTCSDTSTVCSGNTPLCMTSFYDNRGDIHIIKKCASVVECDNLWWNQTRQKKQCVQGEDPYTWSGTWSGECHYCCESDPSAPFWCNYPQYPNKPKETLNMDDYKGRFTRSTPLTTKTTVKTSTSTPLTPSTIRSTASRSSPVVSSSSTSTTTSVSNPTIASSSSWPSSPSPSSSTSSPSTSSTLSSSSSSPSSSVSSSSSSFSSFSPSSSSITPSAASTLLLSTTGNSPLSTSVTTSQPSTGTQCEVSQCSHKDLDNSFRQCSTSTVEVCPPDQPYCLNTVMETPSSGGLTVTVTKRCVGDFVCYNDWWRTTSNNPNCMVNLNTSHVSEHGLICRFCCNSSSTNGDVCNLKARPDNLVMYELPTTTKATTTQTSTTFSSSASTASFTSRLSSDTSAIPYSSAPQITQPSTSASTFPSSMPSSTQDTTTTSSQSTAVSSTSSSSSQPLQSQTATITFKQTSSTSSQQTSPSSSLPPQTSDSTSPSSSTPPQTSDSTSPSSSTPPQTSDSTSPSSSLPPQTSDSTSPSSSLPPQTSDSTSPSSSLLPQTSDSTSPSSSLPPQASSSASTDDSTETTTVPWTTVPKGPRQCVQCGNVTSGVSCSAFDLYFSQSKACPVGLDFCMNQVQKNGDQTIVIKKCVDKDECFRRWFVQTSDNVACINYDPSKAGSNLNCYFCCTTDNCNEPFLPSDSTLFTP